MGDDTDKKAISRLFALHGIPYEPASAPNHPSFRIYSSVGNRYKISVFDMKALQISLLNQGVSHLSDVWDEEGDAFRSRLARLAVRAVYSAGLDLADVTIRVNRADSAVVEQISPTFEPTSPADQGRTHAAAEVQLGMDQEFILISRRGKLVPASRFLAFRGSVGYDSATVRGRDGVHPLAELRPLPSGEPEGLIRNLRKAMWIAAWRINDPSLRWIAGSMPMPGLSLGGHIHFSGIPLSMALLRALDNYLALPLLMLEDASGALRRKKYGRLGDVRHKSHGGFEYRTLPSLLMSPTVTKGAVALAKLIALEYGQLKQRPLDRMEHVEAFYKGEKGKLAQVVQSIWADIERLDGYTLYSKYLIPLKKRIDNMRPLNEGADFRIVWRVPPYN